MDVGILAIFQNYLGRGKDADTVRNEMRIADLVEPPPPLTVDLIFFHQSG